MKPDADAEVTPEWRPSRPTVAEIQIQREHLVLTVPLHELGIDKPQLLLTPNAIRIAAPDLFHSEYVILLPVPVNPAEYRASIRNGILDLVASRWKF